MSHGRWMGNKRFSRSEVLGQCAQTHGVHQVNTSLDATFNLESD
jgi:hypothetical protein